MICDQDKKGEQWDFSLCPVYGIFFLNFKSGKNDKVRTDIVLANRETGCQASNLLREVFIEMPFFDKKEEECETGLDYWLYTLKYMEQLKTIPFKGQKALFERLEKLAKIVNLNKKERMEYEECLKVYRDNQNTWDYAIEKGYQEGVEKGLEDGLKKGMEQGLERGLEQGLFQGVRQVALNMKRKGMEVSAIMECTGLDAGTIAEL